MNVSMKTINQIVLTSLAVCGLSVSSTATVIVNQTSWPDFVGGDTTMVEKTNQNLPFTLGWQAGTAALYNGTNGQLVFGPFGATTSTS
jgi:hypothetical protein